MYSRLWLWLRYVITGLDSFAEGRIIEEISHLREGLVVDRRCRFWRWSARYGGPSSNRGLASKDPLPPNSRDGHRDIRDSLDTTRLRRRESAPIGYDDGHKFRIISGDKRAPMFENLGQDNKR